MAMIDAHLHLIMTAKSWLDQENFAKMNWVTNLFTVLEVFANSALDNAILFKSVRCIEDNHSMINFKSFQ